MKSLREFAHFVGKPDEPISPLALVAYLRFKPPLSVRELLQSFDGETRTVGFQGTVVLPPSGIVPFTVRILPSGGTGWIFGIRWRVLRGGQQLAAYDQPLDQSKAGGGLDLLHHLAEPGIYTFEGTVRGVGKDGYAEATRSFTVEAKPKVAPPPPLPPGDLPKKPDLAFTGGATYNAQTQKIQISFKNVGTANAGAFRVSVVVNDTPLGEVVYNSMAAGQGDTVSFSPGFLPPGDYTYRFVLDLYDTVKESNESNNAFFGTFNIP